MKSMTVTLLGQQHTEEKNLALHCWLILIVYNKYFINFFYFQFKKEKLFLKVKWKLCFDITDDFFRQRNE